MNLLITGAWHDALDYIEELETKGHQVFYLKDEKEALPCDASIIEGIIGNGLFLFHPIESFTSLKYIQVTSAGLDRIDLDYTNKHHIKVCNARGVYNIPMAEYTIMNVLNLYHHTFNFHHNQLKHNWEKDRDLKELNNKTVAIVGCGSIGQDCAKRFIAFNCKVIGIDIKEFTHEYFSHIYTLDYIKKVLPESDVVVITLPLTDQTYHLFNNDMFDCMKGEAVLVNISRGAVVDTTALLKALDTKLYGAVLDVFEEEPLDSTSPLWDKKNAILTPHNSFVGEYNNQRINEIIMGNINEYTNI